MSFERARVRATLILRQSRRSSPIWTNKGLGQRGSRAKGKVEDCSTHRSSLVASNHADDDHVLVSSLTLVGRKDLDGLEVVVAFEDVLKEFDLLAVESDDPDLTRVDSGEDEGASDLKLDATRRADASVEEKRSSRSDSERRTYLMSQVSFSDVLDEVTDSRVRAQNLIGIEEDDFGTEFERKEDRNDDQLEPSLHPPLLHHKKRTISSPLLHYLLNPTLLSLYSTRTPSFLSMHHLPRLLPRRQHQFLLRDLLRTTLELPIVDESIGEFHDVAVHSVLLREIDGGGRVGFVKATEEGDVESSETGVGVLDLQKSGEKERITERQG